MLPKRVREYLFEKASVKTMRYVNTVPVRSATGLVKRVYDMIAEDFFVNGSLSSHSQVPELFAGTWLGGRELVLVTDRIDRKTKEAMGATLSYINDCPYCADMLVSLVHGSGDHHAAANLLKESEEAISDATLRERLSWVRRITSEGVTGHADAPFTAEELPEAIGTLFVLNYVNRFSHVVIDGSPVGDLFKNSALRLFGYELRETTERKIIAGRALDLLPSAPIPDDMQWARPNPRIAQALARWGAAVERESVHVISQDVRDLVQSRLKTWCGEAMPLSRSWVDQEIEGLNGKDYHVAKLVLVVAKASWQFDDSLVQAVMRHIPDEEHLIRALAYAAFSAARRLAAYIGCHLTALQDETSSEVTGGSRGEQLSAVGKEESVGVA